VVSETLGVYRVRFSRPMCAVYMCAVFSRPMCAVYMCKVMHTLPSYITHNLISALGTSVHNHVLSLEAYTAASQ